MENEWSFLVRLYLDDVTNMRPKFDIDKELGPLFSAEVRRGVIGFPLREVSAGAKTERSIILRLHSHF